MNRRWQNRQMHRRRLPLTCSLPPLAAQCPTQTQRRWKRLRPQLPATDTRLRTTDAGGKIASRPLVLWENPAFLKSSYEGKREMLAAANQQALRDAGKWLNGPEAAGCAGTRSRPLSLVTHSPPTRGMR